MVFRKPPVISFLASLRWRREHYPLARGSSSRSRRRESRRAGGHTLIYALLSLRDDHTSTCSNAGRSAMSLKIMAPARFNDTGGDTLA